MSKGGLRRPPLDPRSLRGSESRFARSRYYWFVGASAIIEREERHPDEEADPPRKREPGNRRRLDPRRRALRQPGPGRDLAALRSFADLHLHRERGRGELRRRGEERPARLLLDSRDAAHSRSPHELPRGGVLRHDTGAAAWLPLR